MWKNREFCPEIDRHHRRLRRTDELGGEGMPRRIDSLAPEGALTGRHAAGRKDRHRAAIAQQPLRLEAGRQRIGLRLFGAAEIDRQHMLLELGRLAQQAVGKDAGSQPRPLGHPAEGDAVQHAERMVGDEQHRPGLGNFGRAAADPDLDIHQPNRGIEERLCPVLATPGIIEPLEARLPAQALDRLDEAAADDMVLGARIGKTMSSSLLTAERNFSTAVSAIEDMLPN